MSCSLLGATNPGALANPKAGGLRISALYKPFTTDWLGDAQWIPNMCDHQNYLETFENADSQPSSNHHSSRPHQVQGLTEPGFLP